MTDLSPAAQAVLDAYHQEAIDYIEEWGSFRHKRGMAAALRAAADQIEDLYCDGDVEDSPGIVFALRQLLLIAAELEGFND